MKCYLFFFLQKKVLTEHHHHQQQQLTQAALEIAAAIRATRKLQHHTAIDMAAIEDKIKDEKTTEAPLGGQGEMAGVRVIEAGVGAVDEASTTALTGHDHRWQRRRNNLRLS